MMVMTTMVMMRIIKIMAEKRIVIMMKVMLTIATSDHPTEMPKS